MRAFHRAGSWLCTLPCRLSFSYGGGLAHRAGPSRSISPRLLRASSPAENAPNRGACCGVGLPPAKCLQVDKRRHRKPTKRARHGVNRVSMCLCAARGTCSLQPGQLPPAALHRCTPIRRAPGTNRQQTVLFHTCSRTRAAQGVASGHHLHGNTHAPSSSSSAHQYGVGFALDVGGSGSALDQPT